MKEGTGHRGGWREVRGDGCAAGVAQPRQVETGVALYWLSLLGNTLPQNKDWLSQSLRGRSLGAGRLAGSGSASLRRWHSR